MAKTFIFALLFFLNLPLSYIAVVPHASADDTLKMAIFPRRPVRQTIEIYDPLAKYLSIKIGRKVELVVFNDFQTYWRGLQNDRYDLVHYNQYHYIKSRKEFGYNVIVMNEEFGSSKINAAIIVRKDSGINSIADLKGKKIVFGGGKKAMQSYIGASQILMHSGLKEGDYLEDFAINPPNALMAVYNKMADASGIGEVVLRLPLVQERINVTQLKVLGSGIKLPHLCWAVKEGMAPKLAEQIRRAMIDIKTSGDGTMLLEASGGTGYVSANDREYDIVRKVVKEVLNEDL